MLGGFRHLGNRIKRRTRLQTCERCGLYFENKQKTCPRCQDLDDDTLARYLAQRAHTRTTLARRMLLAAAVLVAIMILFSVG